MVVVGVIGGSMIDFFRIAMERNLAEIIKPVSTFTKLNLGAGNKKITGTVELDYPEWDGEKDEIPYGDRTVDVIWALHFLEHLNNPVKVLQECQRVLVHGGVLNICVPNFSSQIAFQDLDHKKQFTIDTWKTLFNVNFYDKNRIEWQFDIGFNLICGIAERNMVILTQLIKR